MSELERLEEARAAYERERDWLDERLTEAHSRIAELERALVPGAAVLKKLADVRAALRGQER